MSEQKDFDFNDFMSCVEHEVDANGQPVDESALGQALAKEIKFGKYRGCTLGTIASTVDGWTYLEYLVTWDELVSETKQAIQLVLSSMAAPTPSLAVAVDFPLPFGKYNGEKLGTLCKTLQGRQYLQRLGQSKSLKGALRLYLNVVCSALQAWQK